VHVQNIFQNSKNCLEGGKKPHESTKLLNFDSLPGF
jgi:hypothetical protein